jgi:glycosyltransferase involved in cell wall biosynthesis
VDLLAGLRRRGLDAMLVLTGDGPERRKLEAQVRRLRLEDRVRFVGPIPQREMADWYRAADLLLSLLDRTNASNPVFEAMACGRPVAALDAGTTSTVVRDGETGVLVPPDQPEKLADAVAGLLKDGPTRQRLGDEAARRIRELLPDVARKWSYEAELIEAVAEGRAPAVNTEAQPASWALVEARR